MNGHQLEKLMNEFFRMHRENSEEYGLGYYKLKPAIHPNPEKSREYNSIFLPTKEIIIEKAINKGILDEKSFITYWKEDSQIPPFFPEERENLVLRKYLEVLAESDNYLEYLHNLTRKNSLKFSYITLWKWDDLENFLAGVFASFDSVFNVKEVNLGYESSYAYEKERIRLEKVEKFWEGKNYWQVLDECDTIFNLLVKNFSDNYLGKEIVLREGEKPSKMEEIFQKMAERCKVPTISKNINAITLHFSYMRNELKQKIPYKKNIENWKVSEELPETEMKIYTRISIDLSKSLHNLLVILQKEKR